jgi:hypothetical protein
MKRAAVIGAALVLALPVKPVFVSARTAATNTGIAEYRQEPRKVRGDYRISHEDIYRGDLVVEDGHLTVDGEIRGWVVVKDGDAVIRGTVEGDVVVIYGNVRVLGDGLIQGNAVSVEGDVEIRDAGVVTGSNISTTLSGLRRQGSDVGWARIVRRAGFTDLVRSSHEYERSDRNWDRSRRDWYQTRRWSSFDFLYDGNFPLGFFTYNRVDGITAQGQIFNSMRDWGPAATSFYGGLGYGFSSQQIYYRIGLNRYWLPRTPLEVGALAYRQLETEDDWYLYHNENDLFALFARYDFQDYFRTDGWLAYLRFRPIRELQLGARYAQESEEAASKETDWGIFNRNRIFRENEWITTWDPDPSLRTYDPADEGDLHRFVYFLKYDLGFRAFRTRGVGLSLRLELENAEHQGLAGGGAFNYDRFLAEFRGRVSLSRMDHLAVRIRAASALVDDGFTIPVQHRYYLGGIGTLRGYEFKQFTGDRLFLGTVEYTLGGDDWTPFFDDWALSFFFDYGLAWNAAADAGLYNELYPENGLRSAGLGIAPFGRELMKIELAKPLDDDDKDVHYYIRLMIEF